MQAKGKMWQSRPVVETQNVCGSSFWFTYWKTGREKFASFMDLLLRLQSKSLNICTAKHCFSWKQKCDDFWPGKNKHNGTLKKKKKLEKTRFGFHAASMSNCINTDHHFSSYLWWFWCCHSFWPYTNCRKYFPIHVVPISCNCKSSRGNLLMNSVLFSIIIWTLLRQWNLNNVIFVIFWGTNSNCQNSNQVYWSAF